MKPFTEYLQEAELTLEYHDRLNPKLWDDHKLKPEVRTKLLMIARTWAGFAKIPMNAVKDIVFMGSNANYSYSKYSDIDVHLLLDFETMPHCRKLLEEFYRNKKKIWGLIHNIKIYGHDVEPYAQDVTESLPKDQGIYSVMHDHWVVNPTKAPVDLSNPLIQQKVNKIADEIDFLISNGVKPEIMDEYKEKLRKMRSAGLQKHGEHSIENLAFKELRNLGYLSKMKKYMYSKTDQELSL